MRKYFPLLSIVLAAGCVTTRTYQAKVSEAAALDAKASGLAKDLDAAKASLKAAADTETGLEFQLSASTRQAADLQKSNADLQQTLDAKKGELSKKVAELIKERDLLAVQISSQAARIDELGKQLSDAEAAKKALEDAAAAELSKVKQNYEDMTAGLKSEIAAGQIQITQLQGKLTLNMVDKILFDSGQAEVKSDGKAVLAKIGDALNKIQDKDIRIEGHTDDKPIAGALQSKYPTNWELSTARATAVLRYLIDHAAVDPKRLVAAGYGEFRPKASNDTPEGRAQNRRIEIILVPRD